MALIFQKLLITLVPSMHAGNGLLASDSTYFDSVAWQMAQNINLHGWSSWELFPALGARGNVAILGALYAVFGHDPTLIIPINACFHALGGTLIFLLCHEASNKSRSGYIAGIIAATIFVVLPSALNWYGQLHKDGYVIAGMLLILFTYIKVNAGVKSLKGWLTLIAAHLIGIMLIAIMRPYGIKLLLITSIGLLLFAAAKAIISKRTQLLSFLLLSITSLIVSTQTVPNHVGPSTYLAAAGDNWQWEKSEWLNDDIEELIETAAILRSTFIVYSQSVGATSLIDEHIQPHSVYAVLSYFPRALQVGLLAPFPTQWLESMSITKLVGAAEMFIYYLTFPGIIFLLLYQRNEAIWIILYFACTFIIINAFINANVGTLFRVRYAYISLVMMLGLLGWLNWFIRKRPLTNRIPPFWQKLNRANSTEQSIIESQQSKRIKAINSTAVVMFLTLITFIGFFIRDVLMAHKFGIGRTMDDFFIAFSIPMFIVTVLCTPLGLAFIPIYNDMRGRLDKLEVQSFVSKLSFRVILALLIICSIIFLFGHPVIATLYIHMTEAHLNQLALLMNNVLPILLFSGVVILGNAILNAHNKAVLSSGAQTIVPLLAMISLYFWGETHGVKAVIYGMIAGQLLNLIIVQYFIKKYNLTLIPSIPNGNQNDFKKLCSQYIPLVASALFVAMIVPVSTLLAMQLPTGAVSALGLGNKVIVFMNGLISVAITSVLLPYFSKLASNNHLSSARKELFFFVTAATLVTIPACIILFTYAEPIVQVLFERGAFDSAATRTVTEVMRLSIVQTPFFVSGTILLKFAIANRHALTTAIIAFLGLVVHIVTSNLLVQWMGVSGIALGSSISIITSTTLLMLTLSAFMHIKILDVLLVFMCWLLFITLTLCVYFASTPGFLITIFAYSILLLMHIGSLPFGLSFKRELKV